ncbi:hypothetical protein [Bacillus sp. EB01]|uniref:hypothetical protein n=1 Tax=Bacillus sp. EB01 TaxID=1347086 RepID=UPI0005C49F21|nr:hypothetical protein [Bacillus sp. EB01]
MYKLQFVNSTTKEILREVTRTDENEIRFEIIQNVMESPLGQLFIVDKNKVLLEAQYVTHFHKKEEGMMVYKVMLKTKGVEKKS